MQAETFVLKPYSLLLYVLSIISTAQTDFELNPITAQRTFQPETANQSQCINITIRSDEVLEDDESFFVVLDSSEPRIILNPNTSVVTILDSNSKLILHEESLTKFVLPLLLCLCSYTDLWV